MSVRLFCWSVLVSFGLMVSACSSAVQNTHTQPGYESEPRKIVFASSLIGWPGLLDPDLFINEMHQSFLSCDVSVEFITDIRYNARPGTAAFTVDDVLESVDADQYEAIVLVDEAFEPTDHELVFERYFKLRYYDVNRGATVWQSAIHMRKRLSMKNRSLYLPGDILKYLAADGILTRCKS